MTQRRKQQLIYVLFDLLASVFVWVLFLAFRWAMLEGRVFGVDTVLIPAFNFYRALILYPISCLIIYYLSGFYLRPFEYNLWKDFSVTFVSAIIISFGAFFIIIIDDNVANYEQYYLSLTVLFVLQLTISFIPRLLISIVTRYRIKKGNLTLNTVVVGTKKAYTTLKEELKDKNIVTYLLPNKVTDLKKVKQKYSIEEVIIALPDNTSQEVLFGLISNIYPYNVRISFPANVYDMLTGAARIHSLTDNPLVTITDYNMSDSQICIKRAFDMFFSALCLILFAPLFVILSICVKVDSKGPIIYRQKRIGLYGRPFDILKFRTMYQDAEKNKPMLSVPDDPRVTKVGKWLRKYRLDELPQLWNVLCGDMSIVGPRPERKFYIDKIVEKAPYYCLLYKIRPGLTSWGPIRVGYTDTLQKMIQRLNYDIVYMENMSLLLDLKIMIFTIKVIFDGKGQ